MSDQNTTTSHSDLLLLTQAARAVFKSRNTFWRHHSEKIVPPPILTQPMCRWSRRQLKLYLRGIIQRNDHGIWYEKDRESGEWHKLPNQHISDLPKDVD